MWKLRKDKAALTKILFVSELHFQPARTMVLHYYRISTILQYHTETAIAAISYFESLIGTVVPTSELQAFVRKLTT